MNGELMTAVNMINENVDNKINRVYDKIDVVYDKIDSHITSSNTVVTAICQDVAANTANVGWLKKITIKLLLAIICGAVGATGGAVAIGQALGG